MHTISASLSLILLSLGLASQVCSFSDVLPDDSILRDAKAVLDGNWVPQMNSTLPSPKLYPHQWSWDAAFVAIGYSHYNTQRAVDEITALFRGQWRNGLLPHIVFNPSTDESYFPGPSFWRIKSSRNYPLHAHTSGIIQPPVHSIAALSIYRNARTMDDKDIAYSHLQDIYPKLVSWHSYLYNERDPLNEGLVFIRHMWESGMDNSPAWDGVLDAIKLSPEDVPDYKRVDKGKVGHHRERPTTFFYDRAVYLIRLFYENAYDESAIFERCPFLVQDVLFNSILARAGEALADIAEILEKPDEAQHHRSQAVRTATAVTSKLYDPVEEFFYDYDMVAKKLIRSRISGSFVAVFGAKVTQRHVKSMIRHLRSPGFLGEDLSSWTIPSVSREDPSYTNTTYWKGPAWLNINYLVRDGLVRNSHNDPDAMKIASYLMERSLQLVKSVGFYEYFNPISGAPHGGHQFSWSAALSIDWICTNGSEMQGDLSVAAWHDTMSRFRKSGTHVLLITVILGALITIMASLSFVGKPSSKTSAPARTPAPGEKVKKKISVDDPRLAVPRTATRRMRARNFVAVRRST